MTHAPQGLPNDKSLLRLTAPIHLFSLAFPFCPCTSLAMSFHGKELITSQPFQITTGEMWAPKDASNLQGPSPHRTQVGSQSCQWHGQAPLQPFSSD